MCQVIFNCTISKVFFSAEIDGILIQRIENTRPKEFKGVQVFAGDRFNDPSNAKYKNLKYETLPDPYGKQF